MNPESTTPSDNELALPTNASRPPEVRASHLEKLAIVYARQSKGFQVREHTGSTAAQLELTDLPRQWGWPESRILLIDDDLGVSGTSTQNRPGFKRMLELMDQNQVGLIVAREHARLSRDPLDAATFVKKLLDNNILLHASGQLFDGATEDLAQLFGLHLQSLLAWFENRSRTNIMRSARRAKARQGHAVTQPPIGYVKAGPGKWIKDPDPRVQEAIQGVFILYRDTGSTGNVLRYMRTHKLLFPRRRSAEVIWDTPHRSQIANVLSNPQYTGVYIFQRWKWVKSTGSRSGRKVQRALSDWISVPAHHEPYVSHQEWEAIQAALASRRPTVRPPIGRGPALLQGLMLCATCKRALRTRYSSSSGGAGYVCLHMDRQEVTHVHFRFGTKLVDACIVHLVLNALQPLELRSALEAIEDHRTEQAAITKAHRHLLQQAQDEVDELRRRYRYVDPNNGRVKADLEGGLEAALARLDAKKRAIAEAGAADPPALQAEDARALVELSERIEELWTAQTTTNEDRKRLLRLVISRVVVVEVTNQVVELEIEWASGLREARRVLRPAGVDTLVRAMREDGKTTRQIAAELRTNDVTSLHGTPITENTVYGSFKRIGLSAKTTRRETLIRIRALLIEGRSHREILEDVNRDLPASRRWTSHLLSRNVVELRRNAVPGVPPLPPVLPADRERSEILQFVVERREAGHTCASIAEELNASGRRPQFGARFSDNQVAKLLGSRKARPGRWAISARGPAHEQQRAYVGSPGPSTE